MKYLKITAFLGLAAFGLLGAFKPQYFQYLNGTNILFHEAGHLFFMPLGEYWHVWGGTLTQLLIPLGIGIAFLLKGQLESASVMFWWMGQNLFGIAAYIQDARDQSLPFLGGEKHDWEYILNAHQLIVYDHEIGNYVWGLGVFIMTAACVYGILSVWNSGSGEP